MNAKIKWIEDQKMLGESGTGHSVVMDALDSGKGVSPMEMLLLGVGGCTSLDVLSILKKSRQDVVDFEVQVEAEREQTHPRICLLYTSPSPRDATLSRMPSSA